MDATDNKTVSTPAPAPSTKPKNGATSSSQLYTDPHQPTVSATVSAMSPQVLNPLKRSRDDFNPEAFKPKKRHLQEVDPKMLEKLLEKNRLEALAAAKKCKNPPRIVHAKNATDPRVCGLLTTMPAPKTPPSTTVSASTTPTRTTTPTSTTAPPSAKTPAPTTMPASTTPTLPTTPTGSTVPPSATTPATATTSPSTRTPALTATPASTTASATTTTASSDVKPCTVIYHSTGVQTPPPPDNDTFYECFGRNRPIGDSVRGRYTRNEEDPHELRYGEAFVATASDAATETNDSGFQTMRYDVREVFLRNAKMKAAANAQKVEKLAEEEGIRIFAETDDKLIVHTQQIPPVISIEMTGGVCCVDAPNLCYEVTRAPSPPTPQPIPVFCPSPERNRKTDEAAAEFGKVDAAYNDEYVVKTTFEGFREPTPAPAPAPKKRKAEEAVEPAATESTRPKGVHLSPPTDLVVKPPAGGLRFTKDKPRFGLPKKATAAPKPTPTPAPKPKPAEATTPLSRKRARDDAAGNDATELSILGRAKHARPSQEGELQIRGVAVAPVPARKERGKLQPRAELGVWRSQRLRRREEVGGGAKREGGHGR
ncbi:hypothetical protein K458DRAFT_410953 [Lentithecium fluviatile CBS 122367]|uniref:Uncharacterized protein n=1 Tax=Lentithecium fluviatile CBS 122367 TaxID=1168545 RepID=A0A6G1ICI6_9PLEO|nr:hypothetical protein K458DRAFT_410953 [Lentithecium fluviatile CBS 122367]